MTAGVFQISTRYNVGVRDGYLGTVIKNNIPTLGTHSQLLI